MSKIISIEPITDNSSTYFALDGNYGEAQGMVVIDTTKWSEDDWTQIDEAGDSDRAQVALDLTNKYAQCIVILTPTRKGKPSGRQIRSWISG